MLDERVASYRESLPPQPPRRLTTKDDLYTVKPSRNYQAVKSDSDRMKALSNVHRRSSKSTMAATQAYLELLPSMEDMPTPTRRREPSESPARPAIELDRYVLPRLSKRVVLTKMTEMSLDELKGWNR